MGGDDSLCRIVHRRPGVPERDSPRPTEAGVPAQRPEPCGLSDRGRAVIAGGAILGSFEPARLHCRDKQLAFDVDLERVARGTPGFSGADLANLPKDREPLGLVRQRDRDLAVEPPRSKQRRVQDLRPVGGGQDNDALERVEPVHFGEQLVERLLALVVGDDDAAAPSLPSRRSRR
jgi:hypothetical protein